MKIRISKLCVDFFVERVIKEAKQADSVKQFQADCGKIKGSIESDLINGFGKRDPKGA